MKRVFATLLFLAMIAAVVLYAAGVFQGEKVEPGTAPAPAGLASPPFTAQAERVEVPEYETAVGTIRSATQVRIAAQVTARIASIEADAGEPVAAKVPLVVLDDRELASRLAQAEKAFAAALAARDRAEQSKAAQDALLAQAKSGFERIEALIAKGAATTEEMDRAQASFLGAKAGVADAEAAIAAAAAQIERAQSVVAEATVALGHAKIASPIDGVVVEREVDPGELAWPGRVLLVVHDPKALRLEAHVREGLIVTISKGQRLRVELPAAGTVVEGTVAEILPAADPRSRTFRVRVDIVAKDRVYPGMYGRLRIPVGAREAVRVPVEAVARVGQLETVLVKDGDTWTRRFVTTGPLLGDGKVEVLSGLSGGEQIGIDSRKP